MQTINREAEKKKTKHTSPGPTVSKGAPPHQKRTKKKKKKTSLVTLPPNKGSSNNPCAADCPFRPLPCLSFSSFSISKSSSFCRLESRPAVLCLALFLVLLLLFLAKLRSARAKQRGAWCRAEGLLLAPWSHLRAVSGWPALFYYFF